MAEDKEVQVVIIHKNKIKGKVIEKTTTLGHATAIFHAQNWKFGGKGSWELKPGQNIEIKDNAIRLTGNKKGA